MDELITAGKIKQLIREELERVPLEELRWIAGSSQGDDTKRSWWQKIADLVLGRVSARARTEKVLRDLLPKVDAVVHTGQFPSGQSIEAYERTLNRLNPDLGDVIGHMFMKIEDLMSTASELHATDATTEYDERERKKLRRIARDCLRAITQDARRLASQRSRRGVRRQKKNVQPSKGWL